MYAGMAYYRTSVNIYGVTAYYGTSINIYSVTYETTLRTTTLRWLVLFYDCYCIYESVVVTKVFG